MNIYFHPTTIDGSPRRAIVERVGACRPRIKLGNTEQAMWPTPSVNSTELWCGLCWSDLGRSPNVLERAGYVRFGAGGDIYGPMTPEIALRLTRLAVIEWIWVAREQVNQAATKFDSPGFAAYMLSERDLRDGASDAQFNLDAHLLADALNIAH